MNSNFKNNWIVMGYTLLILAAVVCWPVTFTIGGVYAVTKLCGAFFKNI